MSRRARAARERHRRSFCGSGLGGLSGRARGLSVHEGRTAAECKSLDECVDPTLFDIQPEGGEEAADRGEFGKIVIGDDGDDAVIAGGIFDGELTGVIRGEHGRLLDVGCESLRWECREIVRVHPRDEVLQNVVGHAMAERRQGGEDVVVGRHSLAA